MNKKHPDTLIHKGFELVRMQRFTITGRVISYMYFKKRAVYALPGHPWLGYVPGIGKVKITPTLPKNGSQINYNIFCVSE